MLTVLILINRTCKVATDHGDWNGEAPEACEHNLHVGQINHGAKLAKKVMTRKQGDVGWYHGGSNNDATLVPQTDRDVGLKICAVVRPQTETCLMSWC